MRIKNNLFTVLAICMALISLSFSNPNESTNPTEHYSIDQLPPSWKENSSLIRAIDIILPNTVKELEHSISCRNCEAPYSVSLLIDSPIIISQKIEDLSGKKNSGGFNYQCVTTFAFKSSLAVYDYNQRGIAKVLITDPINQEYTTKKKFNLYGKDGDAKLTTEQYIQAYPSEVGPSQQELVDLAEKRMYRLRDEIEKLLKRH
jgi:hypothetical protein